MVNSFRQVNNRYKLKVEGPFALVGDHEKIIFNEPQAKDQGIYIWTIPYSKGGYLVDYIGETGVSFGVRFKEHMIQTLGGNYRISDVDARIQGIEIILWNGLWRKGTRDKISEFVEQYPKLAPVIKKHLEAQVIFTIKLNTDQRVRRRIEGALAKHIKLQSNPIKALIPLDIRYNYRREDEAPLFAEISCEYEILGVPEEIEF